MIILKQIQDYNAPELDIYARDSESKLAHYYEPHGGLFIAESPKVIERALNAGYKPLSLLLEPQHVEGEMKEILARIDADQTLEEVPVYTAELQVLMQIIGYKLTRGALCAMYREKLPSLEEILEPLTKTEQTSRIAVLDNVENPTNVGAIFRSAAAMGMDAVLLTKNCSDPLYRRAIRVSMGTVFQIPWTYINETATEDGNRPNNGNWPDILRRHGVKSAAMALTHQSVSIDDAGLMAEEKLAIALGNEGDGMPQETIEACDYTVLIPMYHEVDSLNVAAASAVAFWQLGKCKRR